RPGCREQHREHGAHGRELHVSSKRITPGPASAARRRSTLASTSSSRPVYSAAMVHYYGTPRRVGCKTAREFLPQKKLVGEVPKPFLHGLGVGVMNSVWITAAHIIFYDTYLAGHAQEAQMMAGSPLPGRLMMLVTGPIIGVISGCVLGLFALIASRFIKPKPA